LSNKRTREGVKLVVKGHMSVHVLEVLEMLMHPMAMAMHMRDLIDFALIDKLGFRGAVKSVRQVGIFHSPRRLIQGVGVCLYVARA